MLALQVMRHTLSTSCSSFCGPRSDLYTTKIRKFLTFLQEPLHEFHLAVYFILTDEMSRVITGSLCPYNDRKNYRWKRKTVFIFCFILGQNTRRLQFSVLPLLEQFCTMYFLWQSLTNMLCCLRKGKKTDLVPITVEPVYDGQPQDLRNWPLDTGGCLIQDH